MRPSDITYGVIRELYECGGQTRIAYGIVAYADAIDGPVTVIASARDVSSDKEAIQELVEACNRLKLSPNQLHDVVEDYLA